MVCATKLRLLWLEFRKSQLYAILSTDSSCSSKAENSFERTSQKAKIQRPNCDFSHNRSRLFHIVSTPSQSDNVARTGMQALPPHDALMARQYTPCSVCLSAVTVRSSLQHARVTYRTLLSYVALTNDHRWPQPAPIA